MLIVISYFLIGCNNNLAPIKENKKPNEQNKKTGEPEYGKTNKEKIISDSFYAVTKIKDGDTFFVLNPNSAKTEEIRLIGIDAPEIHKTPKEDVQCYGKEASECLSVLIMNKRVRLQLDKSRIDRYQRILSYVYLEDSTFVNAELLRKGFADTMNIAPNLKYKEYFLKLRNKSKENKRGMWGVCY